MQAEIQHLKASPIIAVLRNLKEKQALPIIEALVNGGIKNIEVTFGENTNTSKIISDCKEEFKNDIMIGAGTVMTTEQVKIAIEAGSQFIFSPNFNKDVVKETLRQEVISIPGCFTPSEAYDAYILGAHIVKLFPANVLGPGFIKDIKAPMPYLNVIPTGGIDQNNMADFLKSGALAVGVGGSLLKEQLIKEENYNALTKHAKEFVLQADSLK